MKLRSRKRKESVNLFRPRNGSRLLHGLPCGLTFAAATLLVFNLVAVGGGALSAFLSRWPESPAFLQRFSAIVMFGLAGWIGWMNLRKEGSPPTAPWR